MIREIIPVIEKSTWDIFLEILKVIETVVSVNVRRFVIMNDFVKEECVN